IAFSKRTPFETAVEAARHISGGVCACARLSLLRPNANVLSVDVRPALLVVTALFWTLTCAVRVSVHVWLHGNACVKAFCDCLCGPWQDRAWLGVSYAICPV